MKFFSFVFIIFTALSSHADLRAKTDKLMFWVDVSKGVLSVDSFRYNEELHFTNAPFYQVYSIDGKVYVLDKNYNLYLPGEEFEVTYNRIEEKPINLGVSLLYGIINLTIGRTPYYSLRLTKVTGLQVFDGSPIEKITKVRVQHKYVTADIELTTQSGKVVLLSELSKKTACDFWLSGQHDF